MKSFGKKLNRLPTANLPADYQDKIEFRSAKARKISRRFISPLISPAGV
jgi:hypothetical protein